MSPDDELESTLPPPSTSAGTKEEDEEEEVEMTPAEILAQMREAWSNERLSPGLTIGREDLVEILLDQVSQMERNLGAAKNSQSLRNQLHQLELERIKYMIASYLRTRLRKIEDDAAYYLAEGEERRRAGEPSRLSPAEQAYAIQYKRLWKGQVESGLRMPGLDPSIAKIKEPDQLVESGEGSWMLATARESLVGVEVSGSETAELDKDSRYLIPYNPATRSLLDLARISLF